MSKRTLAVMTWNELTASTAMDFIKLLQMSSELVSMEMLHTYTEEYEKATFVKDRTSAVAMFNVGPMTFWFAIADDFDFSVWEQHFDVKRVQGITEALATVCADEEKVFMSELSHIPDKQDCFGFSAMAEVFTTNRFKEGIVWVKEFVSKLPDTVMAHEATITNSKQ